MLSLELGVVGIEPPEMILQGQQLGRTSIGAALANLAAPASVNAPDCVRDLTVVTATRKIMNEDQVVREDDHLSRRSQSPNARCDLRAEVVIERRNGVVEDDSVLLKLYKTVVAAWNLPVDLITAGNGVEGLIRVGRDTPDLMITDLSMPGMDGFELIRSLATSSFREGMEIPMYYDPMLAKLTTYGATRRAAIEKMKWAIQHYDIDGIETTLDFGNFVMNHEAFVTGKFDTSFVPRYFSKDAYMNQLKEAANSAAALAATL